jgi:HEAT repeat protein
MRRLLLMTLALLVAGCGKEKRQYSVAELLESLKDANPETRYWAARQLGHRRAEAKEVVPALTEALKDEDKRVRMGGAYALGEIGPEAKTAVPALQLALKDKDAGVQKGAAYALQQIREPNAKARPGGKAAGPKHTRERRKPEG